MLVMAMMDATGERSSAADNSTAYEFDRSGYDEKIIAQTLGRLHVLQNGLFILSETGQ